MSDCIYFCRFIRVNIVQEFLGLHELKKRPVVPIYIQDETTEVS